MFAAMLTLRASVAGGEEVLSELTAIAGVRRVTAVPDANGLSIVMADVDALAAAPVLEWIRRNGIDEQDFVLVRQDAIAHTDPRALTFALWPEVLRLAHASAKATPRYLILMAVAGLLAAIGVIDRNAILIIGAMAVSPDLLPVSALSVGLVSRKPALTRKALVTLVAGLALVAVAAAALTVVLEILGVLPSSFAVGRGGIGVLARIDEYTVLIALLAGIASMLTFETRESAAVGVAISVTTIPASAYLGVAAGVGDWPDAVGAVSVLGLNVATLVVAGTATLLVQLRWFGAATGSGGT